MKIRARAAVCNHMGNVRKNNEDAFFLNGFYLPLEQMDEGGAYTADASTPHQVYAVCDGMGGEAAGEMASFTMAASLSGLMESIVPGKSVRTEINKVVQEANHTVCTLNKGAGCTLALLCLHEGKATVAWLGDSRIYLLQEEKLFRLSEDHTQSQRLLNMGVLDKAEAKKHAMRHVLTRYIGMDMADLLLQPSYGEELMLKKSDVFLLCSDGLFDMVEEEHFAAYLSQEPARAAASLVEAALAAGGKDNVTAMVVRIEECKRRWL